MTERMKAMKIRVRIMLLCSAVGSLLLAQTPFNVAFHDRSENPVSNLILVQNESYFLTQVKDHASYGATYINKYTADGRNAFRLFHNIFFHGGLFESLDHKVLIWGNNFTCDVADTSQIRGSLCKLDTNGTILFNTTINLYPNGYWDGIKAALQYPDSSFYVFSDSSMFHISKNGQIINNTNLGFGNINAAVLLQNGNMVLARGFPWASGELKEINTAGLVQQSKTTAKAVLNLQAYAGKQRVMGLDGNGKLHKYSNSLDSTGSTLSYSINCTDYFIHQDSILIIEEAHLFRLDSSLNLLSLSTCSTSSLKQTSVTRNQSGIAVLSSCSRGGQFNPSVNFFALNYFLPSSTNNFFLDAELSQLTADSLYAQQYYPFGYVFNFLRAKVKIVNKSNQVLNTISLSSYLYPHVVCGEEYYKQDFFQLNLAPGDTAVLTTNFIKTQTFGSLTVNGPVVSYTWCLIASCPNGQNDKYAINDRLCQTFTTLITSAPEETLAMQRIITYPNPAQNELHIQANQVLTRLELYDMKGRLVFSIRPREKEWLLDVKVLDRGMYMLRVETEKGSVFRKLILQE